MTDDSEPGKKGRDTLPRWEDCDAFCIHDYAGTGASPCAWRGLLREARHDAAGAKLLCPRCGCATLYRIPLSRADGPEGG